MGFSQQWAKSCWPAWRNAEMNRKCRERGKKINKRICPLKQPTNANSIELRTQFAMLNAVNLFNIYSRSLNQSQRKLGPVLREWVSVYVCWFMRIDKNDTCKPKTQSHLKWRSDSRLLFPLPSFSQVNWRYIRFVTSPYSFHIFRSCSFSLALSVCAVLSLSISNKWMVKRKLHI